MYPFAARGHPAKLVGGILHSPKVRERLEAPADRMHQTSVKRTFDLFKNIHS